MFHEFVAAIEVPSYSPCLRHIGLAPVLRQISRVTGFRILIPRDVFALRRSCREALSFHVKHGGVVDDFIRTGAIESFIWREVSVERSRLGW